MTDQAGQAVATAATMGRSAERDRFLDLLRLISVLRVVALHTATKPPVVYLPWIQWIFPGMPEVFFVSGAVTAVSLRRNANLAVVLRRLRRLLAPYYVYAVAALGAMVVTDIRSSAGNASLDRGDWFSFIVPLVRPTGSETRVVLWGHLWFLTAFVWVLAASPFTHWLHQRVRGLSLLLPSAAFFACVAVDKLTTVHVREELYHVTMFGWFFQLGYLYADGALQRVRPQILLAVGAVLGALGWLVAERIEPVWKTDVNELYTSQTGHFFVGAAWMFAAFAFRAPIVAWLDRRRVVVLDIITQRTYTIFIWGPAANAVAMSMARKAGLSLGVYLSVTAVGLVASVLAFGWVEDIAGRRVPRLFPQRPQARQPT